MEPVWELAESVERDEQFPRLQSWTLVTAADDWLWTDFLGTPTTWLQRAKNLAGKYLTEHTLIGKYLTEHRLRGDS